jgi:hypothetical protein
VLHCLPNFWDKLRGESGVPFALRLCKGNDAFDPSASSHC